MRAARRIANAVFALREEGGRFGCGFLSLGDLFDFDVRLATANHKARARQPDLAAMVHQRSILPSLTVVNSPTRQLFR